MKWILLKKRRPKLGDHILVLLNPRTGKTTMTFTLTRQTRRLLRNAVAWIPIHVLT